MNTQQGLDLLASSHPILSEEFELCEHKDLLTIAYGDLGAATASRREELGEAALVRIFEVAEQVLGDGDEAAKDAVATGFLEAAVNTIDSSEAERAELSQYFGPLTLDYIRAWDDFSGIESP